MIARNYIKYPEALRFQCEMFSNGYHNSPRLMRLMEVFFDWTPTVPQWVKEAKNRAGQIVKAWKSRQTELFETMKKKTRNTWTQLALVLFPDAPEHAEVTKAEAAVFPPVGYVASNRWNPTFTSVKTNWAWSGDKNAEYLEGMEGVYVSYCRRHQGGFQAHAGIKQQVRNYKYSAEA